MAAAILTAKEEKRKKKKITREGISNILKKALTDIILVCHRTSLMVFWDIADRNKNSTEDFQRN